MSNTNKPLSKAAIKRRIREGGDSPCLFCKAESDVDTIEFKELDPVEGGDYEQRVTCLKCGRKWIDVYSLVEVRELCD